MCESASLRPPFTGFRPAGFTFLRQLVANQNKARFEENRGFYERDLQDQAMALAENVAAVRDNPMSFTEALASANTDGLELDTSDSMTRMPRGFEDVSDLALVPAIKARNLVLKRSLTKKAVGSAALIGAIVAATEAALPLLQFGWDAMAEAEPPPAWSLLH